MIQSVSYLKTASFLTNVQQHCHCELICNNRFVSLINGPIPSGMWKLTESRRIKYECLSGVQVERKMHGQTHRL